MIVEVNDSIQSQVKAQNQIKAQVPAKAQNQTPAKTQNQSKSQIPAKSQSQVKTQTQVQIPGKTKAMVPVKNQNQAQSISKAQIPVNTQVPKSTQIHGSVQAPVNIKTSTSNQTSTSRPLMPFEANDSIQKAKAVNDSIQQVKKDSIASHTMPLFYKEQFIPGDSIKWTSLGHKPSGFDGISMPYRLRMDDGINGLLLFCFILTAYVFAFGRKAIVEQIKNLFSRKEQTDFFGKATASDLRHRIMFRLQTCILMGIFTFGYFNDYNPSAFDQKSIYWVLGIYIGIGLAFYAIKWIIYSFLGWVFFNKNITSAWLESYSTIINMLGICYFPLVLLMVYYDLSASTILIIALNLIIFAKILMFYKWLKFFFNNLHGLLFLIVYFCALEILPCFLLVQGLLQTNIILQLKL
ncbi:DUF4271 domain-containing protein [uncultured Bacteroides sp.]|uniref:DUF4271 domain-containing protein n=1 Tax=uncultured Bacteroides sp. TaxID=162156 RepID=UPI002AA8F00B|nr:DUF4271 domain-containing protein [uncultured Bacteroides sp.]